MFGLFRQLLVPTLDLQLALGELRIHRQKLSSPR